jgi:hypothetical protein
MDCLVIASIGYIVWDIEIECSTPVSLTMCIAPVIMFSYGFSAFIYFIGLIFVSQMKENLAVVVVPDE